MTKHKNDPKVDPARPKHEPPPGAPKDGDKPAGKPEAPPHRHEGEGKGERPHPTAIVLGMTAYKAYVRGVGGALPGGGAAPNWEDLNDKVRDGWQAAGEAVARKLQQEGPHNLLPGPDDLNDGTPSPVPTSRP